MRRCCNGSMLPARTPGASAAAIDEPKRTEDRRGQSFAMLAGPFPHFWNDSPRKQLTELERKGAQ
jgi:hypothetical protein